MTAITALSAASLSLAGGGPYMVQKVQVFTQTSAAGAVADPLQPFVFSSNALVASVLHLPGGSIQTPVARSSDGGTSYEIQTYFTSRAALDAAYPNGTYTMTGTGIPTLTFNLTGDLYPTAVPQITNGTWSAGGLLVINPSVSTTLNLSNFSTYGSAGVAGHMGISIDGNNANVSQDILTQAAFGIPVSSTPFTSVPIPAGSLTEGGLYNLQLDFDTATAFDLATVPSSGVIAIYENHLKVWVVATANSASLPAAPTITAQPTNQTAPLGASATFTAAINTHTSGQSDSRMTWYLNGNEIQFDNNSTKYQYNFNGSGMGLTINNVTSADLGSYTMQFVTIGGIVYTSAATLTIGAVPAPVITAQPVPQIHDVGQSSFFSVMATGSSLTYQWSKDGVTLNGATTASINISVVQLSDAGSYTVAVTNAGGTTTSSAATLTVYAQPSITQQPASISVPTGGQATFTVVGIGSPVPTYQWAKDYSPIAGATNATLTLTNVQASDAGSYTVALTNLRGSIGSFGAVLAVTTTPSAPQFVVQPTDASGSVGGSLTLTASANALPAPAYQWYKDAVALSGQTNASLHLTALQNTDAGTYKVQASNSQGSTMSSNAIVTVGAASYLSNLSVRAAMTQGQTLIMGFVVAGGAKPVLVRAAGPALNDFGLTGVADPRVTLFDQNSVNVGGNDDWDSALAPLFAQLGAFAFHAGSHDAALLTTINGPYTTQVTGTGSGAILVEAYDAGTNNGPKLTNVSARFHVGTGNDILIAGFVVAGTGTKQVLVRAIGPKLADYGVTGVLADPQLTVYDQGTAIASNDNWDASLGPIFETLGAFAPQPSSKDAAALVTLTAGKSYTVQVSGVGSTTGEALVEIYDAQP